MKQIIEYPNLSIVSCRCGCKFSYESEDMISEYSGTSLTYNKTEKYVICPICKNRTSIYSLTTTIVIKRIK